MPSPQKQLAMWWCSIRRLHENDMKSAKNLATEFGGKSVVNNKFVGNDT
jgi:hypothetical protein